MDILSKSFLKKQDGFTLLEILIVIIILGIITGPVMLNASKLIADYKLKNTAHQLVSHLRYAQQTAISRDVNTRVLFRKNVCDEYYIGVLGQRKYKTVKKATLPVDIKVWQKRFGLEEEIYFTKKGKIKSNGHISLKNNSGKFLHIYVYKTGRFRISTR